MFIMPMQLSMVLTFSSKSFLEPKLKILNLQILNLKILSMKLKKHFFHIKYSSRILLEFYDYTLLKSHLIIGIFGILLYFIVFFSLQLTLHHHHVLWLCACMWNSNCPFSTTKSPFGLCFDNNFLKLAAFLQQLWSLRQVLR